jgi:hypothetical protein
MNAENHKQTLKAEDALPEGYKEVPWPQSGRLVFGPWCLLGAWPTVFGVIEKTEEHDHEKR